MSSSTPQPAPHRLDKPIILLKAGRSDEAARAAMSHTASIVGAAETLDAVCRQYSVFVVSSMEEMLDLGMIFQDGRRVRDRRVGIMTSSGVPECSSPTPAPVPG